MKNKKATIKAKKCIKTLRKRYTHVINVQNELYDRACGEFLNDSDFNPTDYLDEEDSNAFCATVFELEQLDEEIDALMKEVK
jgi:hypothetical protein